MFFDEVANEWGEVLLIPTKQGEAFLTSIIAFLLLIGMVGIQINGQRVSVRKLGYCSLTIGLAALLANFNINIGDAGGNITLFSMLVIALPGFWYGPITGISIGMAYGVFQMLIDPYLLFPLQIAVDYLFAFGAIGLCGIFSKSKYGLIKGYFLGVLGRYLFACISGGVFFGDYAPEGVSVLSYTLKYNALYIFPEAVVTLIIISLPQVRMFLDKIKDLTTEK